MSAESRTDPAGRTHMVFIYGTLLPGERWHAALEGAQPLGPGQTLPAFELLDLESFPAMASGGDTAVLGELYLVDERGLTLLDQLEGHPQFGRRTTIRLADGRDAQAWLLPPERRSPNLRAIASGSWRAFRSNGRRPGAPYVEHRDTATARR